MKNKIKYIILALIALISINFFGVLHAKYGDIPWAKTIEKSSISNINASWDIISDIKDTWFDILAIIKLAFQGILIIFIVYTWAQMIWSMWEDEEALNKGKRQIRYSLIALLFINIPWTIYNSINREDYSQIWEKATSKGFLSSRMDSNLFFDSYLFGHTFWEQIIWFLEVIIIAIAIVMIIYEWLALIWSRWREEKVKEAKTKITYSILALVFVWIIEAWKNFAFSFKISDATNIFSNLADLALFFAAPVAFFFLTIAWYYYLTSAWDEDKIKKAKSIVINTILATLILLAAYTFLIDLANL